MPRVADQARIDQKRLEIIEGAAKCFSRSGLDNATTDEICREAGISPGRLYYYFSSREDIVLGVAQYIYSLPGEDLQLSTKSGSIAAILKQAHEHVAKLLAERSINRDLLLQINSTSKRRPAIRKIVDGQIAKVKDLIEAHLTEQIKSGKLIPETNAKSLASVLTAMSAGWESLAIADEDFDLSQAAKDLDLILAPWAR